MAVLSRCFHIREEETYFFFLAVFLTAFLAAFFLGAAAFLAAFFLATVRPP